MQKTAGEGSGFTDEQYVKAGAKMLDTADEVWQTGDMIVKVKEPIAPEYPRMRENQLLFTYLHLAPEFELTKQMMERKVTGVAYETITDKQGRLPLLTPMSEVAGRMSVQVGATYLEKMNGGRGILLGGVPGVPAANVVIIGGGIVGTEAAKMAVGLGRESHDHRSQSRSPAPARRYFSFESSDARFVALRDSTKRSRTPIS